MGTSIWEGTAAAAPSFGELNADLSADVVIVGAGISGLTAAMLLAEAGKKVVVLEAMRVGLGTTGNSTGNLYATIDGQLAELKKKWDTDTVRNVVESRMAAISQIEQLVRRFNIRCDFERTAFHQFTENSDKETEGLIEKEYEVMQACNLNPIVDSHSDLPFTVAKVLTIPNQAQFHPLNYARGLAANLPGNCSVYENSPVVSFDEEKGIVKTDRHTVTASHIIMATHVPKGVFAVHTVLGPYREFGVAGLLRTGVMPQGIFWGLEQPKHSLRFHRHEGDEYVLVIGDKFKTGHPENTFEYIDHLQEYLRGRFDIAEFRYIWGGQQYRPADGLPYIGRHSDRLYYLTGFSTDGLVYGTLGAMIIHDMILGRENPWQKIYNSERHTPVKSAKDFIKENADNLVQYIKDIPWKVDAGKLDDIAPGEGKILQEGGEKIAVYKDINGAVQAVSAVCTHMKCIVNWNTAEKTWDCPCHGSRFKTNGEVIEGPAIFNLPSKKIENKP